jgi:hypothetical protein
MESRSTIGYLKKTIEQIRRERAMQREGLRGDDDADEEGGGGAAAASEENDGEEKEHMKVPRLFFLFSCAKQSVWTDSPSYFLDISLALSTLKHPSIESSTRFLMLHF